jgi:hypothetical protein
LKILLLFIFISIPILAQISPGDLTKAHAYLEGMSNCTKCHELGEKINNNKCLDCHKEIGTLILSGRGYHSSSEVKGKNCWKCHSEHNGRNFRIISFSKESFDHNKTGFTLSGKHKNAECSACHKQAFIKDTSLKKRKDTYLGLDYKCSSCHEDYHQKQLANDCSICHSTDQFRPAVKFNHDNTSFKLSGMHSKVECVKCHAKEERNGQEYQKFKGIAFTQCSNCHKDVHHGTLGADCKKCHQTTSFKNVSKSDFDHNKTQFPLLGKHAALNCQSCHKGGITVKLNYTKCTDCHKDLHYGDFTSQSGITDCSNCHTVNGFSPSLFTVEKHNESNFKLTGNHLAVPCISCHKKNNEWHFKNIGMKCSDCHEDIHKAELKEKYGGGTNCSRCHETNSWNKISFDHNSTLFVLEGKHIDVSCSQCHRRNEKILFASVKGDCDYCHKDVHLGQFKSTEGNYCLRCHTFQNWKPEKFNHDNTGFLLQGAHKNVKCSACHKQIEKQGIKFINYKIPNFKCASCHS